jgi:hypothetical protein
MPLYRDFDEKLIKHIWRTRNIARRSTPIPLSIVVSTTAPSLAGSQSELTSSNEKLEVSAAAAVEDKKPPVPAKRSWWSWRLQPAVPQVSSDAGDPEKGSGRKNPRKLVLLGPFYAGCGAALAMCAFSSYRFWYYSC